MEQDTTNDQVFSDLVNKELTEEQLTHIMKCMHDALHEQSL